MQGEVVRLLGVVGPFSASNSLCGMIAVLKVARAAGMLGSGFFSVIRMVWSSGAETLLTEASRKFHMPLFRIAGTIKRPDHIIRRHGGFRRRTVAS